ncbi:cyclase-like protein 3 isoform X2 [Papaver somniferum]|uniref:cyclase-like protein 3 isoform X2 n=1 Tax=Papaver somniferum TaxID=3469 RepID=UPI000E70407E|nr:cyclase-like protein 3 isoform X2 [Papaver somniferum]
MEVPWSFILICTIFILGSSSSSLASSPIEAYPSSYGDDCNIVVPPPPKIEVYGKNGRIIDITHEMRSDLPIFGSPEGVGQLLRLAVSMKNGSLYNISELKLITHTGTHVDAPGHFYDHYFDAGFDVNSLDLDLLNGPVLLVDVPRNMNITAEAMESLNIPRGVRRVLFRTLNTDKLLMYRNQFDTSFVGFTQDGAQWLKDHTDIKMELITYPLLHGTTMFLLISCFLKAGTSLLWKA